MFLLLLTQIWDTRTKKEVTKFEVNSVRRDYAARFRGRTGPRLRHDSYRSSIGSTVQRSPNGLSTVFYPIFERRRSGLRTTWYLGNPWTSCERLFMLYERSLNAHWTTFERSLNDLISGLFISKLWTISLRLLNGFFELSLNGLWMILSLNDFWTGSERALNASQRFLWTVIERSLSDDLMVSDLWTISEWSLNDLWTTFGQAPMNERSLTNLWTAFELSVMKRRDIWAPKIGLSQKSLNGLRTVSQSTIRSLSEVWTLWAVSEHSSTVGSPF